MNSFFNLKGKIAVITGVGGVLGRNVSKSLAQSGVKLAVLTRNVETLKELIRVIESAGGKVIAIKTNILSKDSLIKAKDEVIKTYGNVDLLLNIAGGNLPGATIGEN